MKNPLLAFIICLLITGLHMPSEVFAQHSWKVVSASVTFKIKNAGLTVDGSFKGLKAEIQLNPAEIQKASISASVDAGTINTGIDLRDSDLKKSKYFDVAHYPEIRMQSSSFSKESDGTFKGVFKVTIKNISRYEILPFTFIETATGATMKGFFSLNRRNYQVGSNSLILADDVVVFLEVVLVKK